MKNSDWPGRFLLCLCTIITMTCEPAYYIPTDAEVRQRFATFITTDAIKIRPILKDSDVDTMIASYCVKGSSAESMVVIMSTAIDRRWKLTERSPERLAFEKCKIEGTHQVCEVAEVRRANDHCLVLAWVTAHDATPGQFARSGTARWARREFWPYVDRAVREVPSE